MESNRANKRARASARSCDDDIDEYIQKLKGEWNFQRRIELMNKLSDMLADMSKDQHHALSTMIDDNEHGLFDKTWGSMSFALKVKAALDQPNGRIGGLKIMRILQSTRRIGRGGSGEVLLASVRSEEQDISDVAVKFVSAMIDSGDEDDATTTVAANAEHVSELRMLARLCDPSSPTSAFCVQVHGIVIGTDRKIGIVMERYAMDLSSYILANAATLSAHQRLDIFRRCVQCVQALHEFEGNGIVHNDIKPQNFLVRSPQGRKDIADSIIITDFGFSKERIRATVEHLSGNYTSIGGVVGPPGGTIRYAAAEVRDALRDGGDLLYTNRSDIYSLGVLLGFIHCNRDPFSKCKTDVQVLMTPNLSPYEPEEFQDPLARQLFVWCTAKERDGRPRSCKEILELLDASASLRTEADVRTKIASLMAQKLPLKSVATSDYSR